MHRNPVSVRRMFVCATGLALVALTTEALALPEGGWSQIPVTGGPGKRREHTAIYDPAGHRMIVFGGVNDADVLQSTTWSLSLSGTPTWTQIVASGPPARSNHSAVYANSGMIVFGGTGAGGSLLSDTWQLSLSGTPTWTQLASNDCPRTAHAVASNGTTMYVFGGLIRNTNNEVKETPEIFSFAPWASITPTCNATGLDCAACKCGTDTGSGGCYPTGPTSAPGRTGEAVAVWDPVSQRLIVHGGHYDIQIPARDATWAYSLGNWTALPAGPYRTMHSGVYSADGSNGRMVVFGGADESGVAHNDTWELTLGSTPAWRQLSLCGTPPAGGPSASAVYDPDDNRMIVYGGGSSSQNTTQDVHQLRFDSMPPSAIGNLFFSSVTAHSVRLTWTAPGDDGNSGTAASYEIRYRTEPLTLSNWDGAVSVSSPPTPAVAGTAQSKNVTGLDSGVWYYFGVRARDECNLGGLSNAFCIKLGTTYQLCEPPEGEAARRAIDDDSQALQIVHVASQPNVLNVSYSLRSTTPAQLHVVDVAGRSRGTIALPATTTRSGHAVFHTKDLEPGFYVLRLTQDDHRAARSVVITH